MLQNVFWIFIPPLFDHHHIGWTISSKPARSVTVAEWRTMQIRHRYQSLVCTISSSKFNSAIVCWYMAHLIQSDTKVSSALYRLKHYIVSSTISSLAIYRLLLCAIVCWYTWHMWCMIYLALILNSNLQIWCTVEWLGTFCEIHYTLYQVWNDRSVW